MYLLARENLYGVTHNSEWAKKLEERFHYFLTSFIEVANRYGATVPLAIAEDKDANLRAFISHNGPLLVLGMMKSHMEKSELVRCGLALLIVSVNILRNHISHSALESERISLKLANIKKNAPSGKITMKSLKGMLKKQKTVSSRNWMDIGTESSSASTKTDTKTDSSEKGAEAADNKPPPMLGKSASIGVGSLGGMMRGGGSLRGPDMAPREGDDGGGIEGGLKAFHLAGELATHRGLIEWATIALDNLADGGRSVSVCVNLMLHTIVFSVRQLSMTLLSLLVLTTTSSSRAMLMPLNSSKESLEVAEKGGVAYWTKEEGGGDREGEGPDSPKKKKKVKAVKKVPTALEKSLESAFASTSSFPIIAKRLGVYCPENDPKLKDAKRKKQMAASNSGRESEAAESTLSKEEQRRKQKEKMQKELDAREKGPSCLSFILSLASNERNSTIFAAAADIVLALTCDLDIPKRKTVELSVGPKGIQAKHTRTTIMLSGPKGASASTNTASSDAAAALHRTAALSSGKHKSPHRDPLTDAEGAGAGAGGLESAETEMANLMSAFCYRVSKAPTCLVPTPDPNVGMGNGVKGSLLAKKLRQEMTSSGKDEEQKMGGDDGGAEGGKKGGPDGDGPHSNWACLHLLIGFLDKNLRYFEVNDDGDHILGKGGLSLAQQQQLVYAFHRSVAAVSRLGIKSREALYYMHTMGAVDGVVAKAMEGLRSLSKNHEQSVAESQEHNHKGMSSHKHMSNAGDLIASRNSMAESVSIEIESAVYINSRDLKSLEALAKQLTELLKRERKKFLAQAEEVQRAKGIYIGRDGRETRLRPKPDRRAVNNRRINGPMSFTQRPVTAPGFGDGSQESSVAALNSLDLSAQSSLVEGEGLAEAGSFGAAAMKKANQTLQRMGLHSTEGMDDPPVLAALDGTVISGPGQRPLARGEFDLFSGGPRPGTSPVRGRAAGGATRPLSRDFGKAFRADCAYSMPEFPPRRGLSPSHKSRDDGTSLHKVLFQGKASETPGIPPQLTDDDVERVVDDLALKYDGNNPDATYLTATNPLSTERYLPGGSMDASQSQELGELPAKVQGSMKLPEGMLEARKLLRALQKSSRDIEKDLVRTGYTSDGRHSVPILERARRVYYPPGQQITPEMQELGDLGSSSTTYMKPGTPGGQSAGLDRLKEETDTIKAENFERAEAHATASFEATEDARKHRAFIDSMLELTKDVVKDVDSKALVRDVSRSQGIDMVEQGMRRAISSREGSREPSREGGSRGDSATLPDVSRSVEMSLSASIQLGPEGGYGGADDAGLSPVANPRAESKEREDVQEERGERKFVDSLGFYEPEIERRMKEAAGEEKQANTVVQPRGLFGVGMTTDDFDFETPDLLDLKPIYALGTETLFPDKEDEEDKERRAQEKAQKEAAEEKRQEAIPKELTAEEQKQKDREDETAKELAKMGFGAFDYDETYGDLPPGEGGQAPAEEEDGDTEPPMMHASGSRTFNADVDSLPPSARADAKSVAVEAMYKEMDEEKSRKKKLGLQQEIVKEATRLDGELAASKQFGRAKKPEVGYKESAARRVVTQGENVEFLFPDQRQS